MLVVSTPNKNIQQVVSGRDRNKKKIVQAIIEGYKLRDTYHGRLRKHSQYLNARNYGPWSTKLRYYFLGQELSDIISRSDTTPPTDAEETKRWKVKARRAIFVLSITIDDAFLQ